jgi:hypothetical protein
MSDLNLFKNVTGLNASKIQPFSIADRVHYADPEAADFFEILTSVPSTYYIIKNFSYHRTIAQSTSSVFYYFTDYNDVLCYNLKIGDLAGFFNWPAMMVVKKVYNKVNSPLTAGEWNYSIDYLKVTV